MGAIALRHGGLVRSDKRRLALFSETVGKGLIGAEIDQALEWCELYGANPFTKDIYFFIFDADKPEKRRVVPVLGIGLYRKIAARTGNYRPDSKPARFTYDEGRKSAANPAGIVDCEVTVYLHSHGEWHPTTSRLKWEERAPIKAKVKWEPTGEVYEDSGKPKKKPVPVAGSEHLDPDKKNWHTMPETMLAKCCEADALRRAWPSEMSGSYVDGELDASNTLELTATEIIEAEKTERNLEKIGGSDALIIDWCDGKTLDRVPFKEVWDRSLKWMRESASTSTEVRVWLDRNRFTRAEMKAKDGATYLPWWREVEKRVKALEAEEGEHESSAEIAARIAGKEAAE